MFNRLYTNFTLMPKNEQDCNLFKNTRHSDVQAVFKQVCVFMTCFSFVAVIMMIADPSMTNFNQLMFALFSTVLHWILLAVGYYFEVSTVVPMVALFIVE